MACTCDEWPKDDRCSDPVTFRPQNTKLIQLESTGQKFRLGAAAMP